MIRPRTRRGGGQDTDRALFGGIFLGDGGDASKEELERGDEYRDGFAENGAELFDSLVGGVSEVGDSEAVGARGGAFVELGEDPSDVRSVNGVEDLTDGTVGEAGVEGHVGTAQG